MEKNFSRMKYLAFFLLCSLLCITHSVNAQTWECGANGNNVTATLDWYGILTISGVGDMANYELGRSPWYYNRNISSVIINEGVTSIGNYAFHYCCNLTSVSIPNSLTTIGYGAFSSCSELKTLSINRNITTFDCETIRGCLSLTDIIVDDNNTHFSSIDGVLFNKEKTVLIRFPQGKEGAYVIPDGVTTIGKYSFEYCNITSISIPECVTSIEEWSFWDSINLTSIKIPEGVTSIGEGAFAWCEELNSVVIPNGITSINDYTFQHCDRLTSINIPSTVVSIGQLAFAWCGELIDISIPDAVTNIGECAFLGCSKLTQINIPDAVTDIGEEAFWGCSGISSVAIPNNVTSISRGVFGDCSGLINVIIPEGVISIARLAFSNCSSLSSITIPRSVDFIGERAFYGCIGFTTITIPDLVSFIGDAAFASCTNLTSIYCNAITPPTLGGNDIFKEVDLDNCILYVPNIEPYKVVYPWSAFGTILPITGGNTGSLEVQLPAGASGSAFQNMTLELTQNNSEQIFQLTITDLNKYTFGSIPYGNYRLVLKNKYGIVLGTIDNIKIESPKKTVSFTALESVYDVKLTFIREDGQNLSTNPSVKWYDATGTFLSAGDNIIGLTAGTEIMYQLQFNETLGTAYVLPAPQNYTVVAGENVITVTLKDIPKITLMGLVRGENAGTLSGAVVTVSQILNGQFSSTFSSKTDNDGRFSIPVHNDSTIVIVSYPGFLNQTIIKSNFNVSADLDIITLSPISGTMITLNLTYTKSVVTGETPVTENWYADYRNVDFKLFNRTKNNEITQYVVQYPEIVLIEPTDAGDEIEVTAMSRSDIFNQVLSIATIDQNLRANVQLNIVQRGLIRATYSTSGNTANTGILYDSGGKLVKQFNYVNRTFESNGLPDGAYTLVSMANSRFYNSVLNLPVLSSAGLVQNSDYVLQNLTVRNGGITEVSVSAIPAMDESKLFYTGAKTLFSVNKTTITAGNYLTLRAELDFKEEVASKISNVKLVADIPGNCVFVDNSLIVGNAISNYSTSGSRITVPVANYSEIIRFCIVPIQEGKYSPNAFIQFDLEGETIMQPIGAANFTVESLSIFVPEVTVRKTITIRGAAQGKSEIEIFDKDILIGRTQALANGDWSLSCELHQPYAFSYHDIYAKVNTPQGLTLKTKTKQVIHNISALEVSKVTMINVAHPSMSLELCEYVTVFDFINPAKKSPVYWYWPKYPDFTFLIEFNNNDPELVSDVRLHVLTSAGKTETLPAIFDPVKQLWIATGTFDSYRLPVNVNVINKEKIVISYEKIEEGQDIDNILLRKSATGQTQVKKSLVSAFNDFQKIYFDYLRCTKNSGDGIMFATYHYEQAKYIYISRFLNKDAISLLGFIPSVSTPSGKHYVFDSFLSFIAGSIVDINVKGLEPSDISKVDAFNYHVIKMLNIIQQNPCDDDDDDDPEEDEEKEYNNTPAKYLMDPSGIVYEAVPSNRLEGVTTTLYFKTQDDEIIFWDAEEYAQENPMYTNKYGEYGWDVPAGVWQVKFEKDGYLTVYSDWLPVPPPQLDVNMSKVQPVQPTVQDAQGFESGINIQFDKYMKQETMTTDLITVTRNGADESGTIVFLDLETNPLSNDSFVSKVHFVPSVPFNTSDEVILTIKREVTSYAGIMMVEDFVKRIEIQKDINTIEVTPALNVPYNGKAYIEVSVAPDVAAAGMTVTAQSVSPSIATVTGSAVLDATGKALLQVSGELPGVTVVNVSVENTDLKAETNVKVSIPTAQLTVNRESMSFGNVIIGSAANAQSVTANGAYIAGSIRYFILGDDASAFNITETSWNANTGGTLSIVFAPEVARTYNATLEIYSPSTAPQMISLRGTGVTTASSVPVTGISIVPSNLSMKVGEEKMLTVTVLPENATNKTVSWSSSNALIVSVNNGKINAHAIGNVTITVTSNDGGKMAECVVTVSDEPKNEPTGIEDIDAPWVSVFPNPTDGKIFVVFAEESVYRVIITDLSGTILKVEDFSGSRHQIDVSSYPQGVYLLTLENSKQKRVVKIVKY